MFFSHIPSHSSRFLSNLEDNSANDACTLEKQKDLIILIVAHKQKNQNVIRPI